MNQPVIQATGLCKEFGDKRVLQGVNLSIPEGSIVGLLGTNGSGKTTLIQCLLGLLRISSGSASVFGDNPWDLSAETKSRLAYVPQVVKFYPWMNVGQMIEYTGAFYPSWDMSLCDELVQTWELDKTQKVSTMSLGQQQRMGLVLAMGHHPELLILDEPAASLDPIGRRELLRTLLDQSETAAKTVLFSTHITSDLERVASHVAILRDGIVSWFGRLDDLKDSVKRLRITASTGLPKTFSVPGLLRQEVNGSTAVLSVAELDEGLPDQLKTDWNADVTVEDLNLEDIFLELHDA